MSWGKQVHGMIFYLQCFDTGGGAQEGHPVCKNCHGCWFIGGADLTGALHDL